MKIGFSNEKYVKMQSEHIRERISQFGGKLYLEFGGKLFDDYHASRVLPGFEPDSKLKMLMQLRDQAGDAFKRAAPFETFSENEVRDLVRQILVARGKGQSVRACVMALSGGDRALMLRYQNKYRSILRKKLDAVQRDQRKSAHGFSFLPVKWATLNEGKGNRE